MIDVFTTPVMYLTMSQWYLQHPELYKFTKGNPRLHGFTEKKPKGFIGNGGTEY